jgi:hypothetical protein
LDRRTNGKKIQTNRGIRKKKDGEEAKEKEIETENSEKETKRKKSLMEKIDKRSNMIRTERTQILRQFN